MTEADEIWLVSSWTKWEADLLPESLNNLKALTPAKLVVFGRKDFGNREPRAFYNGGLGALLGREAVSAPHVLVQDQMAQTIPEAGVEFVDLQLLLCESHRLCSNATRDGLPISFDGAHLTRAGARLAGARLDALLAVPARHASLN